MNNRKIISMLFSLCAFSAISMIPQHVDAAQSLEGDSIYQIMVDRFYDGDSSNNAKGEAFRNTENTQDDFRYMHEIGRASCRERV